MVVAHLTVPTALRSWWVALAEDIRIWQYGRRPLTLWALQIKESYCYHVLVVGVTAKGQVVRFYLVYLWL